MSNSMASILPVDGTTLAHNGHLGTKHRSYGFFLGKIPKKQDHILWGLAETWAQKVKSAQGGGGQGCIHFFY